MADTERLFARVEWDTSSWLNALNRLSGRIFERRPHGGIPGESFQRVKANEQPVTRTGEPGKNRPPLRRTL